MALHTLRRLTTFAALSLLAHALLIEGVRLQLPRSAVEPPPLEARLQEIAPPAPPPPRPRPEPRLAREPAEIAPPPVAIAPISTVPAYVPAPQAAPAIADAPPAASPTVDEAPAPPARRLPRKGEISYILYLGTDRFSVGRTQQTWVVDGDRYRLTSVSETTGLAAVFVRQRLDNVSRGHVTAAGLRPDYFATERLRSGKTEAVAAKFDWNALTASIDNPQRSVALPAGAQDIVSFAYQLGLAPPAPGRISLPVTNGWKLERYDLVVGAEETLETPLGPLRVVPITQARRAGEESIELWLAPAHRWLPVRIRFFDREGKPSGEQLVSEIHVSDE